MVYPPIFDINYFRHFLDILENYNLIDDEPMWDANRVVAPTPGSTITIPETANEFAIKVDEDEDPKEEEFKEEEDLQKEEDDMEVDIEEDENELELTYPYEEVDPLNPSSPTSKSEPEDAIEVKNLIEHEDETVPASVHEVGESSTSSFIREDSDGLLPGTAAMEKLVEKLGNAEDKVECKKLKKELEKARFSNTFIRMQNERVERDLYWTRVRAHEFYQEMIPRGFVFEERPNEAIKVSIKDENSPSSEPRGSPHDA
nr:hypothetical protein [Tanacetum cinerariifolium]